MNVTNVHIEILKWNPDHSKPLPEPPKLDSNHLRVSGNALLPSGELRPLQQVPCDFVLGPASARETLAEAMASKLILDGYCETMVLDQHKNIQEMLAIATGSLEFERVPAEFEPYYLGVDSKEKHALIDFEEASNEVRACKLLETSCELKLVGLREGWSATGGTVHDTQLGKAM